jgi:hypothetical protein
MRNYAKDGCALSQYAKVPVGAHASGDGANLVIAATLGDTRMMDQISQEYPAGDQRLTSMLITVAAIAALALRTFPPEVREHFLDHVRGIARREYITARAEIDDDLTLIHVAGLY